MEHKTVYYENLKYLHHVMKIIGLLPFSVNQNSEYVSPSLGWILYSVVVYILLVYGSVIDIYDFTTNIIKDFNFYYLVLRFPSFLIGVTGICLPVTSWISVRNIIQYRNGCSKFEVEFSKISTAALKVPSKKFVCAFVVFSNINSISFNLMLLYVSGFGFNWKQQLRIAYIYHISFSTTNIFALWLLECLFLKRAGKAISDHYDATFDSKRTMQDSERQIQVVNQLTKLWISLADIVQVFTVSHSLVIFYIIILFCTGCSVDIYSTALWVIKDQDSNYYYMNSLLSAAGALTMLFLYCIIGDQVIAQINSEMKKTILEKNMSSYNRDLQDSVWAFLKVIDTVKPKIKLSGVLTINRALMIGILSSISTYLIVLKQFDISSDVASNRTFAMRDIHMYLVVD